MNDIDPSGSSNYLQIQLLQSWLQARRNRGSPSEQMLSRGFCIDKYTVESALGAPGGSGAVYKAVGGEGEKAVAVKVFHAGSISALQREVDVLQAITHQNIVRVFDHGTTADGLVYMVMELLN